MLGLGLDLGLKTKIFDFGLIKAIIFGFGLSLEAQFLGLGLVNITKL